ncbi:MAG: transglutaminase domain-containing protein [Oscillospiraceae bacterium]
MKKFWFEFKTSFEFSQNISEHSFSLRCLPKSDGRQLISDLQCEVLPAGNVWYSFDSFGNSVLCGRIPNPHNYFLFKIKGCAEIKSDYKISGISSEVYRFPSRLTIAGKEISDFYKKIKPALKGSAIERSVVMSNMLYEVMQYVPGSTDVNTNAEFAFEQKTGVCQDYTHILLSLCRLNGIKCRYVSGLANESGETHAWAEIFSDGVWTGIDPTNNRLCSEMYIAICRGRDYADCPIERGLYLGNAVCRREIYSKVI